MYLDSRSRQVAWCLPSLVNNQLDAQFPFSICLFQFSACFEQPRARHQKNQLYEYNIWYVSLYVGDRLVCRLGGNSFPTCILVCQSDTYQMLYWYSWFSWWWARGCSKHVENWNKHIEKNCASSWLFTRNIPRWQHVSLDVLVRKFLQVIRGDLYVYWTCDRE
jgi:hypothetical protein